MFEKASQHEANLGSIDEVESPIIDRKAEKKLLRKLDLHIIPMVMLLYLCSFLDRVNIGNARLFGLEEDLNLNGNQFQLAVSVMFVTYILSELPSNLVLKKFGPSHWLAIITTVWGVVATLTGLTQNLAGLVVCRLFLGMAEGGLFPGLAVYLTLFYTKKELGSRIAYLFVSSALSGSVGGLIAYGISYLDGVAGLRGWRWIMILEGIPTCLVGIATWFVLADGPESAYYLSPEERQLLLTRMRQQVGHTGSADQFHKKDVIKGLKDWKIWIFCLAQFFGGMMLYGYSTFLPTIIKGLGKWSAAQVQALTIPCYALGATVYLIVARLSDITQQRGIFAAGAGIVCLIGYGLLIATVGPTVHYAGCLVVGAGLYVFLGIPLSWVPMNQPRYGKRTTATGLQLSVSNFAGIVVPFTYVSSDAPNYFRGHGTTLALVACGTIVFLGMSMYFRMRNRKRSEGQEDSRVLGMSESEIAELGDDSPGYMFTY